jgi:hypothetical protein
MRYKKIVLDIIVKIIYKNDENFMKRILILFAVCFIAKMAFSQEIVQYNDIVTENRKYAILYYYTKVYANEDYTRNFIERISASEPYQRFDFLQMNKLYDNEGLIYYYSGDYILSSKISGECTARIKLIDTITGDKTIDELITDLTFGYENFSSYEHIIETGEDQNGLYTINKRWELGKAEFFLDLFKKDYYYNVDTLVNIEYIDHLFDIY